MLRRWCGPTIIIIGLVLLLNVRRSVIISVTVGIGAEDILRIFIGSIISWGVKSVGFDAWISSNLRGKLLWVTSWGVQHIGRLGLLDAICVKIWVASNQSITTSSYTCGRQIWDVHVILPEGRLRMINRWPHWTCTDLIWTHRFLLTTITPKV
jgi:hypothetical protein